MRGDSGDQREPGTRGTGGPAHGNGHGDGQAHGHGHGPGHGHGHTEDLDWSAMADELERENEIRLPFLHEAADWLGGLFAAGAPGRAVSRLLDVGSGPGVSTAVLARAFPEAEAVAVDGNAVLLERAARRARAEGVAERLTTRQAELPDEAGALGTADLVWTSHVLHHLGDQQAAVDALASAVRPGGLFAIAEFGLSTRYLPRDIGIGRPGLQTRMEAVREDWFTQMRAGLPGHTPVVEDWRAMLVRAGLEAAGTRSFLIDVPAPVDEATRAHVREQVARMRDMVGDRLDADDLATLDRLLDDDAPDGTSLARRPDVFYLSAVTVHAGRAPADD